MAKLVITLQKIDGSKGISMAEGVYRQRVEAVKDLFMLWSKLSKEELIQHLSSHPGIQDDPAAWLPDLLEHLVVEKMLKEAGDAYVPA